jgi:hypothetical protein
VSCYISNFSRLFLQLTWTEKFARRKSAEDSLAFYSLPGVQAATGAIFYHGYDCNYGPAEDLGWQCSGADGLNTTCPFLDSAAAAMKDLYDKIGRDRPLWMTEVCYASEFGDYNVSKGCPALPRLDFQDGMQVGPTMLLILLVAISQ